MPGRLMCARLRGAARPSIWRFRPEGTQCMPKGSILVIDDEAEIREGLELLLKTEGYQVSMAETAQSGLARLGEQPFDLLLLDVSLPDRNGIELLKDIRRHDQHIP